MPSIEDPRNARSRRTRHALLVATRELIEQDGLPALTMTSAAERAGVSRRAAYLHFGSRNELIIALYRHLGETERLGESLQAVWDAPDAVSALTEWAAHIARAHPRILSVSRAVETARHDDPGAAAMWQFTMDNWLRGCTRLAEWLERDGVLHPAWTVDAARDMIWSLMSWDLLERLTIDRTWTTDEFAGRYSALLTATFVDPSRRL
ncbi:TetR/AcrR family transcriptional regulator [Jiangella gansuensis]|uniref:TetR/AcrR family transcriptional regulator n=1 Tax=Jiangella gansuensis TaxID=281473 RepID=UPI0004AC5FC4|nr:TetR/AcrR family transcriptional regulator [Jiangella gansuensis]